MRLKVAGNFVYGVVLLACVIAAVRGRAMADPAQLSELDSALFQVGLNREAFMSDRAWMEDDTFLLPTIREALTSPIRAYELSQAMADACPNSISDAESINEIAAYLQSGLPEAVLQDITNQLNAARPTQIDAFEPLLSAFALASAYRAQAFQALTAAEQEAMVMAAPLWFEDEDVLADDTLKGCIQRAFGTPVDTSIAFNSDSLLSILPRVNRHALVAASYALAKGMAIAAERWSAMPSPFKTGSAPGVEGLVVESRDTPYGKMVIGGPGPNTYSGDFSVIIDLGGDDRYLSRVASAVGPLGRPVSAILDLKGNDTYLSRQLCDQSSSILGLSILGDLSGDDVYAASAFSQASTVCGMALLYDGGGNDTYRAGMCSQAAAICGIAALVDGGGRDLYDIDQYGQGFASTFGFGVLNDLGGNDVYRAGGAVTHAPLRPEDYRSMAQGFAIGARPLGGGGFGLLLDHGGNDFYDAEIYAQGVGYWYSLGALIDDSGNDAYNTTQYCQGAGIHLAAGVLVDRSGDDRYGSRFGPGQGAAHDLAVGFMYDGTGDDQYTISGGQGMAITNSAALCIDGTGNDLYATNDKGSGPANVRPARSFGNLGVFADGEGHDVYSGIGGDSSYWTQGVFGYAYDVPRDSTTPREAQPEVILNPADTLRPIPDLFREASLWEVTDNREKVKRARLALEAKGPTAVKWVGENKLGTFESLERRAITELFKAFPDSAAPYLLAALNSSGRWERRNAISIYSEMKYKPGAATLVAKLADPTYARLFPGILTALGDLGDTSVTMSIVPFASSQSERERIAAVSALGKLQDIRGYESMLAGIMDTAYTVRSAAVFAIAQQDKRVLLRLEQEFSLREIERLESLLMACGLLAERWKGDDKLKGDVKLLAPTVKRYIEHPDPRVQGAALVASAQVMSEKEFGKLSSRFSAAENVVLRARWNQAMTSFRK